MSTLYTTGEIVLLAANPYHLGLVRADQEHSRASVLVEWLGTEPVWMHLDEIVRESTHRLFHPLPLTGPIYDIFEPALLQEPQQLSLLDCEGIG